MLKPHKPYESGAKVLLTTTNKLSRGGQFIFHAKALTWREIVRVYVDTAYRRHNVTKPGRVFRSAHKRCIHCQNKKKLRHRSRHRPFQNRQPSPTKLPQGPPRRPDQRRDERRQLQHAPHPQVLENFWYNNHCRIVLYKHFLIIQNSFLTTAKIFSPITVGICPAHSGQRSLFLNFVYDSLETALGRLIVFLEPGRNLPSVGLFYALALRGSTKLD